MMAPIRHAERDARVLKLIDAGFTYGQIVVTENLKSRSVLSGIVYRARNPLANMRAR